MKKYLIIFCLLFLALNLFPENEYDIIIKEGSQFINKDNKKALEIFDKAKKTEPLLAPAYIFSGMIKYFEGNTKESMVEFKTGVSLGKDKKEKDYYIKTIDDITSKFKTDREFNLFKEAYSLIENNNPKKAVDILLKALKLNSYNSKLYYDLGYAYIELNDFNNAIKYLELGRAINPTNDKILNELQYCYTQKRMQDKINDVVTDRLMIGGDERAIFHELGFAYANNGEIDKSVEAYEKLLKKYPDYYISYYTLGNIYLKALKNKEKAKYNLEIFLNNIEKSNEFKSKAYNIKELIKNAEIMLKECK